MSDENGGVVFTRECLCKRVGYEVTAPARFAGYCHCEFCREFSGADCYPFVAVDPKSFRYTKGAGNVTRHAMVTPTGVREFCATCGAYLRYSYPEIDWLSVPRQGLKGYTGENPAASIHCFVESKAPWVKLDDGLPQFAKFPPPPAK